MLCALYPAYSCSLDMYVGETGLGVHNRLARHESDLKHRKTKDMINRTKKLVELQVSYIAVYYACYPFFYNSIVGPEFALCDLGTKSRRLLEESALVNYFQPYLNAQ